MSQLPSFLRILLDIALAATLVGCASSAGTSDSPPPVAAVGDPSPTASVTIRPTPTRRPTPAPSATASALPTPAPESSEPLPELPEGALGTTDAGASVGNVEVVCGRVASAVYAESSRGSPTFLNLDQAKGRFTIVIWGDYRALFDEAPEALFSDGWICIQGMISSYHGVPQIVSLGGDIAHPSRFIPLTGEARECLVKGSDMSIYCTVVVDEARWENQLYLDALDAQWEIYDDLYNDFEYPVDDYVPDFP